MKKSLIYPALENSTAAKTRKWLMRLCVLKVLVLMSFTLTFGSVNSQLKVSNLKFKNCKLSKALQTLEQKTNYDFIFSYDDVRNYKVSANIESASLDECLKQLLSDLPFNYKFDNDVIIVSYRKPTMQQQKKITVHGKITDEKGLPLPGVSVVIKGSYSGVATNENGDYSILANGNDILIISFVGMEKQEIAINKREVVNIVMKEKANKIEDVVVTGYFQRKKDSYTGATTTFKGDELRKISTDNVLTALSTIDPSFSLVVNNEMGSDPNNMPDFVIRGAGSLKNEFQGNPNAPTFIMDGFEVSAEKVFDLDPNRVRSITILKDAAATAIYGSRAANGVVVITTKIPKTGNLRVSYRGSLDLEVADLSDYNLMNSKEKFQFEQNCGLYKTDGSRPEWDERKLQSFNTIQKLVSKGIDTDWMAIPVRDVGVGQKHTFSFEGGDSKFRYSFDVNYSNKVGVMKESGRRGMGVGIRLQYNYKKFKFMNYLSYDNIKSKNSPFGNYSQYSYLNPYYYPYNKDGSISQVLYEYTYYDRGYQNKKMYNGLYNTTLPMKNENNYNDFMNNFSVEYDILDGLKFKSQISINSKQSVYDKYLPKDHIAFVSTDYKGSYTQSHTDFLSYDLNAVLSYTKNINKHLFNAVAVYNISERKTDISNTTAVNYPNQYLDHIGMGTKYKEGSKPTGSYDITRLVGMVGNFNYSYDNKYLFDASLRSDASSLFGSKNRWGTFGSIGLGWNIHNESFMKNNSLFNTLKLRASWGLTGGQNFYAYQALTMLSYTNPSIKGKSYDNSIGAVLKALGNEKLKWQRTEKRNIGIDFETKNKRFSGYFNVYSDISKDALVNVSLAPSTGFHSYMENLGEVKNSGFEFNIRASIIKNLEKNLQWDIFANIVHNKNELLSINNALSEFNKKQDATKSNKTMVRYQQGRSINTIWANESLGIDPVTGNEVFLDINDNLTSKWSSKNYKPLGNRDPKFYGNFGTRLSYKGFEFNAAFTYSYGGDIYNNTLVDKVENIDPHQNGDKRILTDRWQKPGDIAKYKGYNPYNPTFTRPTSRFIEEENFVQLRSLSCSYQFSPKYLKKIGIERLKLSAIGNNVFRLSTVEMERGINYPFARRYSFLIQLTF